MTEAEAKQRWCPFVRHIDDLSHGGFNRYSNGASPLNLNCVGSDCMAWRQIPSRYATAPPDSIPQGYCGLAGKL